MLNSNSTPLEISVLSTFFMSSVAVIKANFALNLLYMVKIFEVLLLLLSHKAINSKSLYLTISPPFSPMIAETFNKILGVIIDKYSLINFSF